MKRKRVQFTGTASTTYRQGIAVAYNRDYGTAATLEESRDKRVEPISQSNNLRFAGVLAEDVELDSTGIEWVTIYEPGGCAYLALGSDAVVDTTLLWFTAGTGGAGRWRADKGTGLGRGCALALQTNASGVLGESIDGTAVVNGTAVTDTGLFTGAAAGDYLVIMASATAAGAAGATAGVYTISSVTDTANAVLTTSASSAASEFAGYVVSGNPTCLAYLYDGEETGGIEWIECLDNAASQSMVGGFTHIIGGVTLGTGDATATLADGTYIGEKKGFRLAGALTTSDYVLTVTTAQDAGVYGFDADGDELILEWAGVLGWKALQVSGPDVGASGSGARPYAETCVVSVVRQGGVIKTEILIDLTGLSSTATAGDIIGELDGPGEAWIYQIKAAVNGTIVMGRVTGMELPTTGDDDIMIYSATEATGVEDSAIGDLTETSLLDPAAAWSSGLVKAFTTVPPADGYLYLVGNGDTAGTYDAGKLLIELWGV
jgi:hypothetical protein